MGILLIPLLRPWQNTASEDFFSLLKKHNPQKSLFEPMRCLKRGQVQCSADDRQSVIKKRAVEGNITKPLEQSHDDIQANCFPNNPTPCAALVLTHNIHEQAHISNTVSKWANKGCLWVSWFYIHSWKTLLFRHAAVFLQPHSFQGCLFLKRQSKLVSGPGNALCDDIDGIILKLYNNNNTNNNNYDNFPAKSNSTVRLYT